MKCFRKISFQPSKIRCFANILASEKKKENASCHFFDMNNRGNSEGPIERSLNPGIPKGDGSGKDEDGG